jgi:hypothetical protein
VTGAGASSTTSSSGNFTNSSSADFNFLITVSWLIGGVGLRRLRLRVSEETLSAAGEGL